MTKICPKCNTKNADSSGFCQNCGEELPEATSKPSKTGGIGAWWSKRGSGAKVGIIVAGLCCIGLIGIVVLAGMASPDKTTSTNTTTTTAQPTNTQTTAQPASTEKTPTAVTISELNSGSVAKGTLVKVTGTVSQSDGYSLRLRNSDYQDILIVGTGLSAYEDQTVTVTGTYTGPSTYTTVTGAARTVPTIEDGKIV